jgi:hypothetical protein
MGFPRRLFSRRPAGWDGAQVAFTGKLDAPAVDGATVLYSIKERELPTEEDLAHMIAGCVLAQVGAALTKADRGFRVHRFTVDQLLVVARELAASASSGGPTIADVARRDRWGAARLAAGVHALPSVEAAGLLAAGDGKAVQPVEMWRSPTMGTPTSMGVLFLAWG